MTAPGTGRPLRVVVAVVEVFAVLATVATVVLLFANEPAAPPAAAPAADGAATDGAEPVVRDGAAVYADECAACHGADGGGGVGPTLSGGAVVAAFPDGADQTTVVVEGQGGMPSFGDRLSEEEIAAVVEYTRSL